MSSQEEDAKNVIAQWEQSYKTLEETNAELSESLDKAGAAHQTLQALQTELDETKRALASASEKPGQNGDTSEEDGKFQLSLNT